MDYQYTVTGGTPPFTFSISAGALPTGLSMDSSGLVTGTRTTPGFYSWTVHVEDALGEECSIEDSAYVLGLEGATPDGVVGTPYTTSFHGLYGVGPYVYAVTSGALPAGLTMSAAGVVTGIPTTVQDPTFTVQVTDSQGIIYALSFDINITAPVEQPTQLEINNEVHVTGGTDPDCTMECAFTSGGTFIVRRTANGIPSVRRTGNWFSVPAANVGNDWEIRIQGNKTKINSTSGTTVMAFDSGWLTLNAERSVAVAAAAHSSGPANESEEFVGTYTIREIASPIPTYPANVRILADATV